MTFYERNAGDLLSKQWDEARHPRGKTTEASTDGSFAPGGGDTLGAAVRGATSGELTAAGAALRYGIAEGDTVRLNGRNRLVASVGGTPEAPTYRVQGSGVDRDVRLSPKQRDIEDKFAGYLEHHYRDAVQRYEALSGGESNTQGGRLLSVDIARELSDDYLADRTMTSAVHEPGSWFIKQYYAERLAMSPEVVAAQGHDAMTVFTAGGTGSGKTTAIADVHELDYIMERAHIVYDTNLANWGSASRKIDQSLSAGFDVNVAFVYRDPAKAMEFGVIPRAQRQEEKFGSGRTVPVVEHVRTHTGSVVSMQTARDHYGENLKVNLYMINNSFKKGEARLDDLGKLTMPDEATLVEQTRVAVERARAAGKLSDRNYAAIMDGFNG